MQWEKEKEKCIIPDQSSGKLAVNIRNLCVYSWDNLSHQSAENRPHLGLEEPRWLPPCWWKTAACLWWPQPWPLFWLASVLPVQAILTSTCVLNKSKPVDREVRKSHSWEWTNSEVHLQLCQPLNSSFSLNAIPSKDPQKIQEAKCSTARDNVMFILTVVYFPTSLL